MRYRLIEDERKASPRPNFIWGDVWCLKCNAACDFDITGTHRSWSAPDSEGFIKGGIYIRAEHHGETLDIHLTHQQARHLKASNNPRIEIFGDPTLGSTDEKFTLCDASASLPDARSGKPSDPDPSVVAPALPAHSPPTLELDAEILPSTDSKT